MTGALALFGVVVLLYVWGAYAPAQTAPRTFGGGLLVPRRPARRRVKLAARPTDRLTEEPRVPARRGWWGRGRERAPLDGRLVLAEDFGGEELAPAAVAAPEAPRSLDLLASEPAQAVNAVVAEEAAAPPPAVRPAEEDAAAVSVVAGDAGPQKIRFERPPDDDSPGDARPADGDGVALHEQLDPAGELDGADDYHAGEEARGEVEAGDEEQEQEEEPPPPRERTIIDDLDDADPDTRREILRGLADAIRAGDETARQPLIDAAVFGHTLEDRVLAVELLGQAEMHGALRIALMDPDLPVAVAAALTLCNGLSSEESVSVISANVRDEDRCNHLIELVHAMAA